MFMLLLLLRWFWVLSPVDILKAMIPTENGDGACGEIQTVFSCAEDVFFCGKIFFLAWLNAGESGCDKWEFVSMEVVFCDRFLGRICADFRMKDVVTSPLMECERILGIHVIDKRKEMYFGIE